VTHVQETEFSHQIVNAQKIPLKKEQMYAHHAQTNVPLVNQMVLVLLVLLIETQHQPVIVNLDILKLLLMEKEFVKFVILDVKNVLVLIIIVTLVLLVQAESENQNVLVLMDNMTHVEKIHLITQ
jgi:hypothetical protein